MRLDLGIAQQVGGLRLVAREIAHAGGVSGQMFQSSIQVEPRTQAFGIDLGGQPKSMSPASREMPAYGLPRLGCSTSGA